MLIRGFCISLSSSFSIPLSRSFTAGTQRTPRKYLRQATAPIFFLSLFLLPLASHASVAFVQANSCSATGTSLTCSYATSIVAGDLLVADVAPTNVSSSAYTISVSDSRNGAWTQSVQCFNAYDMQGNLFYLPNSAAGSVTVTVTSSTSAALKVAIAAYSGIPTSSPVDVNGTCSAGVNAVKTVTAPSVTTSNANDLILNTLSEGGNPGSVTASSPYVLRSNGGTAIADQIVSSARNYAGTTFSWTYSGNAFAISAAFKDSGSGATVATPTASPAAGTYSSAQSVSLSDTTSGAIICYTTDGSTPAATTPGTCSHGTTYSNPISVSTTTTIKALGTLGGDTNSSVFSGTYTIQSSSATVILCPNHSETGNYAACAPSPTLAFGNQGKGTASMAIPISVNNCSTSTVAACTGSGSVTLAGTPFTISGNNAADFTVSNGTCSPDQDLTAGEYCEPTITFTPTASIGSAETATLTVQDSGATTGSQTMALTGTSVTVTDVSSSSCPTALAANINYQLTANISCAGTAFTYSGNGVDVNLNGYTITYGTASQITQIGAIDETGYNNTVTVHNGTILHGAGTNCYSEYAGSAYSDPAPCSTAGVGYDDEESSVLGYVAGQGGSNTIDASNLTINYNYEYANAIETNGGAMVVHDVTINSTGVGTCGGPNNTYPEACRDQGQSYAINQFNAESNASGTTHLYNISQFGGPQGGITFNSPGAVVDYNYLNPGNPTGTNTNEFAVQAFDAGASIHNNLILIPITANSETRGVIISGPVAAGGQSVYANYLGAFAQPNNTEYRYKDGWDDPCADAGTYSLQFDNNPMLTNTASRNIAVATALNCAAIGLRVSDSEVITDISSENSYTATRESGALTCVQGAWADHDDGCAYGSSFDGTKAFTSENDSFKGDSADVYVSDDGGVGITLQSPTFYKGSNPSDFHTFGAQNGPLSNNEAALIHIIDATFGSGTSPTDAELAPLSGDAGPASFYIDWTQTVTVTSGTTGKVIPDASVSFTDRLGNSYPSSGPCTTDASGQCLIVVTEYRDNNDGAPTPAVEDRNPYSLAVSASGCTTNTQTGLTISEKADDPVTMSGGC